MAVETEILYTGQLHCTATHGPSGKQFTTDAPVDNGGKGEAFSPTDLVGVALGTCAITVMGIVAQRHGWELAGTRVKVVKQMVSQPTRRIGSLKVTLTMRPGLRLSDAERALLVRAADTCPVKATLHPDTKVEFEYVWGS